MANWLLQLDRRVIFLMIAIAVTMPFVLNWILPVGGTNPRTQSVFDAVQSAKPGEVLLISFDYGPSTMPELQPMALALIRHALTRGLRVIGMTLDVQGSVMADEAFKLAAGELPGKVDGTDFVNLGFKPGDILVIQGMGEDIGATYTKDAHGRSTKTLPVMRGLHNFDDIHLVVDLASSDTVSSWFLFGHGRYHAAVAAGVTAVMATDYYPYLDTGQLVGLLNGLRGAAEYEGLLKHPGRALLGMTSQSMGSAAMVLFVILGNIGHFWARRRRFR